MRLSTAPIHLTISTPPAPPNDASPTHLRASSSLVVASSRLPERLLFSRSEAKRLMHGAIPPTGSPATSAPSNEGPCHVHFTLLSISMSTQVSRFLDGAVCGSLIDLA